MRTLTAAFTALIVTTPLPGQTFDFEDVALPPVAPTTGLGLVSQEIGVSRGFDFFGIGAMSGLAPVVGVPAAAGTGLQYAFVGGEGLGAMYRVDLRGFNFYSAFLSFQPTTAGSVPGRIIIRGYRSGDTDLASLTRTIQLTSTATRYDFDLRALQQLEFETADGSGYLAIDDLTVSTVPEPSTIVLLASGLAGVVGLRCRRRVAA